MSISRRSLLSRTLATSVAFGGMAQLAQAQTTGTQTGAPAEPQLPALPEYVNEIEGFGPLVSDPAGLIDLPEGFSYQIISRRGDVMDDGLLVPGQHDGMACFPHGETTVALVRNHEIKYSRDNVGPFGADNALFSKIDDSLVYDFTPEGRPLHGGTTTLIYDVKAKKLVRHHLSLVGTSTNCAGGATPWGSWLTCEETEIQAGKGVNKDHGFVYEVPASATGLVKAEPIKAMGRFDHEAVCVDPKTGIVYLTEDKPDSVFYRFIPKVKGKLHMGGKLQALMITDHPSATTTNKDAVFWKRGDRFNVSWIDLDEVESPNNDLRVRAFNKGAARFAREEGIHFGDGEIYFCCTSGGKAGYGQIMRYVPSPKEGKTGETAKPATLELFLESDDLAVFEYGDNLTTAPDGNLYVCEDRYSTTKKNHIRIVTLEGKVATFARNVDKLNSEWAGVCFSPDGSTLFANLQNNGVTVAITGPWGRFKA